jgi:hypothetical protein
MAISKQSTIQTSAFSNAPIYSAAQLINFAVAEMPPNTRIYVYCNDINISEFCAPVLETAQIGQPIVTNQLGTASGYLYIPSDPNTKFKFLVGEINLTFGDSPTSVADSKYISESIFYNYGLDFVSSVEKDITALRRNTRIRTNPTGNAVGPDVSQLKLDPMAQTFTVDETAYPLGLCITGLSLFVYQKDATLPLAVEIRPVVNGKPSLTEYITGSFVIVDPAFIDVYDGTTGFAPTTNFQFDHPLYLRPGQYAFCVLTKSNQYELLAAKAGDGKTVKQPFSGKLYLPQNTGEWVASDNIDLTFVLRKAVFDTGTVTIEMKSVSDTTGIEYDRFRFLSTTVGLADIAYTDYKLSTTTAGSRLKSSYKSIKPGLNADLSGLMVAKNEGDVTVQVSLTSKNKDVTPILDRDLIGAQLYKTYIDPYSYTISQTELRPAGGTAACKYISKPVSLADGFDSTGIEVILEVSRPIGSDVEVFCRVLARDDRSVSNGIYDRPYTKMELTFPGAKTYSGTKDIFNTEKYKILDPYLSYSSTANGLAAKFDTFATYQIKVVFYANDPLYTPKLKSLTAAAVI